MTYKIVSQTKAWWPVRFNGVTEDGAVVEHCFEMRFIVHDEDSNVAMEREVAAIGEAHQLTAADGRSVPSAIAAEVVMKLAEDWRGLVLDDGSDAGQSLPFTAENVALLMRVPNVFAAVGRAYQACRAAEPDIRRGN